MSLETKIVALAQAMGTDVKALRLAQGDLTSLTTTTKTSLVAAINELVLLVANSGGAGIDDGATSGGAVTWSVDKITSSITAASNALKDELVSGAGPALDTLAELAAALGDDPNFATTIATELGNRVRYDAPQTLTEPQKAQARANIGAGTSDLVIGTTSTTAKAGNYVPTWAEVTSKPAVIAAGASAAAARTAIGAADDANLTALVTAIGDTERDLAAVYAAAKV
ncbi:hypothetical protein [Comamonas aquatica]|uniref:hypothetical protein n=1 Tax=Comamonas aquatica TaxID=225991 RepID=UPI00244797D5|nr:hypothetical protein [Comamonas aquatica]MDH0493397.1 hypothetical protein [Comamonas aquatica]